MSNTCKNCGRQIKVMAFRGTDWCSENCRRVLLGKVKCSYIKDIDFDGTPIEICDIHGCESKYGPERGPHRPCLAVEPY